MTRGRRVVAATAVALLVLGLALAWRFTALSQIAAPEQVRHVLADLAQGAWAPLLVLLVFLGAGFVAFPVNILILATAAVFGPWLGLLYSAIGAACSALVMFFIGERLGKDTLARLLGPRLQPALGRVRARGMLAVVTLRIVPVAPFTVINLAAGASGIRLADFVLGSAFGMAPGMVLMSVMGNRIVAALAHPSLGEIAILLVCIAGYIALAFVAQTLLSRRRTRSS